MGRRWAGTATWEECRSWREGGGATDQTLGFQISTVNAFLNVKCEAPRCDCTVCQQRPNSFDRRQVRPLADLAVTFFPFASVRLKVTVRDLPSAETVLAPVPNTFPSFIVVIS